MRFTCSFVFFKFWNFVYVWKSEIYPVSSDFCFQPFENSLIWFNIWKKKRSVKEIFYYRKFNHFPVRVCRVRTKSGRRLTHRVPDAPKTQKVRLSCSKILSLRHPFAPPSLIFVFKALNKIIFRYLQFLSSIFNAFKKMSKSVSWSYCDS